VKAVHPVTLPGSGGGCGVCQHQAGPPLPELVDMKTNLERLVHGAEREEVAGTRRQCVPGERELRPNDLSRDWRISGSRPPA
jgi:hypothetical protein